MPEFTRVLCAVDFTDESRRALDCALWWARWQAADVSVLHVHRLVIASSETGPAAGDASIGMPLDSQSFVSSALSEAARAETLARLEAFVAGSRTDGLQVEVLVDEDANVADAIIGRAEALAADLIVIATGGRENVEHGAMGAVTNDVMRSASCSVLCIPRPATNTANPCMGGIHRIVCPVDFSDPARAALACAAALSDQAPAHLAILHVVELFSEVAAVAPDFDKHREVRIDPACTQLVDLVRGVVGRNKPVEEVVATGTAPTEILKLAAEQDADLIVMGARGSTSPARAGGRTTSEVVTRRAACPVLFVCAEPEPTVRVDSETGHYPIGMDGSRPLADSHG